jgi:hypothetical protein
MPQRAAILAAAAVAAASWAGANPGLKLQPHTPVYQRDLFLLLLLLLSRCCHLLPMKRHYCYCC